MRRRTSRATGAQTQTGVGDEEFVALPEGVVRRAARARATPCRTGRASGAAACRSPNRSCSTRSWPRTTRRGWCWRSSASTTPRRRCWSRAPTSSAAGTCPRSSTARSGCRASPNRRPDPTWPACAPPARTRRRRLRRQRPEAVGQRRYARRLVPAAGPHRPGCAQAQGHFVLPAGHDHARASRCGRSATPSAIRTSARSSSTTSRFPAANLVGAENAGWQVAQATLGAERGMTMLELAERLGNAGFRWLVQSQPDRRPDRGRPAGAVRNRDHRPARAVPQARRGQRGRHRRPRRRLDRQAVLQRAAAADDRLRRRDRRPGRAHRAGQADVERLGVRVPGCSTSSARGSGRSPAGPARSSAPSSASAGWACRGNRARS